MSKTGYIEALGSGRRLTAAQKREQMADNMEYLHKLLDGQKVVFAIKMPHVKSVRHPRWRLYTLITKPAKDGATTMTLREISSVVQGAAAWSWDSDRSALIGDPYDDTGRVIQHWLNKTWPDIVVTKI
jgi:hypothetical protein